MMVKTKEIEMINDLTLGFRSLDKEYNLNNLTVKGSVPQWLKGSFIRNSVSKFEFGESKYNHWFDGIAMFHSFSFDDGKVNYHNKFLQSSDYLKGKESGKIEYPAFATNADKNLLQKAKSFIFKEEAVPNTNVNITSINGEFVAMTETPDYVKFSPTTLDTLGIFQFDDNLKGQTTTAHPHYDFKRNNFYNILINYSKTSHYVFYKITGKSNKREVVASIPVERPGYIHAFSMTDNYLILIECPLLVNPLSMMFSGKPYIENYNWKPEQGTTFYIVEKDTGNVKKVMTSEAFFTFHPVNAFEEKGQIVIDIPAFKDSEIINDFYMDKLRNKNEIHKSELKRYRLDLNTNKVNSEILTSKFIELPRINYKDFNGKDYSYFYANSMSNQGKFLDQIVSVNVKTGKDLIWSDEGCYPGEPIFIKKPGVASENTGIVLSTVLNTKKGSSFLIVLDAESMEELARVEVPHHIPFGFHGQFLT